VGSVDPASSAEARAALARALARELRLLCTPDDDPGPIAALAEVERWLAWGFNPADRHRAAWVGADPAWDHLARRHHPLVVVHGDGDPLVPPPHGERIAARAGAPLRVVGGAGHALTPTFVPAVVAAVGEVSAEGAGTRRAPAH
jgi:pimeloyl-ACP methyl ester carboxylesterase